MTPAVLMLLSFSAGPTTIVVSTAVARPAVWLVWGVGLIGGLCGLGLI